MPELPEVEVVRRGLEPLVKGKTFAVPKIVFTGSVRYPSPSLFLRKLPGQRVCRLKRKGKYLSVELESGGELVVHLRMTGRLVYLGEGVPPDEHLRVVLPFTGGQLLYFSDMRKFGGIWLLKGKEEHHLCGMGRLGPDILDQIDKGSFIDLVHSRPGAGIKGLLLNQYYVAGLGNIYTDESLYRSAIHPLRKAGTLSREEVATLYDSIDEVLKEGIGLGGTSSRDYRDGLGNKGGFQERLKVYGRKGDSCSCGCAITRIRVAGRGTYYCPSCQKE